MTKEAHQTTVPAPLVSELQHARDMIDAAQSIVIIQAENPDGDSLGSALLLEHVLGDLGKDVSLHCPVEIPKYLRYIRGWDRVEADFNMQADLAIIVDTSAQVLLSKTLDQPGVAHWLQTRPVLVIDHHLEVGDLPFSATMLHQEAAATSMVVLQLAEYAGWKLSAEAAENGLIALMSDSLGLSTPSADAAAFAAATRFVELGANNAAIEERRREFMKKAPEILAYKGELLQRIEYYLDGKLAVVHVPWEDIRAYSDQYNPSALVIDEMRLVDGVEVCVAIKTYPDQKLTGKVKTNLPIAHDIAGAFGGGGHAYVAGFRIYESYETGLRELIAATDTALQRACTTAAA